MCACSLWPVESVVLKFGRWISPKDAFGVGKVAGGSILLPTHSTTLWSVYGASRVMSIKETLFGCT